MARQILLLHNILFDLLLPDSFDQEHQSVCFMPESWGPLWDGESREAQAQANPLHSLVSSLLLALSRGILAPDPASLFKKNPKKI